MPEVILWDLMDTLVRDPFFTHMAPFFGLSFEQLLEQKHPTAWRDFELGEIGEQELFSRFFRDGRPVDGAAFKRAVGSAYCWIDGMEELVRELNARETRMHLLSNYPPWFALCDARVGFSRFVAPTFVSCRTGVRKPAPGAFLNACQTLGIGPERCLFVDDRSVNCEAARQLGMPAFHFRGDVPALRGALAQHGLLPPEHAGD